MKPLLFGLLPALLLIGCNHGQKTDVSSTGYRDRIGTAVQTGGRICLSIENAQLQPRSLITLVVPSEPQSVAQAEIVGPSSAGCPGIRNETPAPSNYDLHSLRGTLQDNLPLIAVVGGSGQFTSAASPVTAELPGDTQPALFRVCTSADGVHLTVWHGKPLEGPRLWHQYYYLGQDLEPNCTPKDTVP